jgi:CRISPR-associated protein (TIGR03986 family)
LSPADRVFGWVRQTEADANLGAYRGNLRVGPVCCETADAVETFDPPLPLAILGQPKPNQARFYLSAANGTPLTGKPVQDAYHKGSNRLQGRKAYPHHARLDPAHWDDAAQDQTQKPRPDGTYQEYRRAGGERDDQNRSMRGWVRPGATFAFDVHVTNLSDVELGALLWLLGLPADGNRHRFHRVGGGKPLGFGSVSLKIEEAALATGADLARH